MGDDAIQIGLRLRMDRHEADMKKLIVYGYAKGCTECQKRSMYECIKAGMTFAGFDIKDEKEVDALRKLLYRMENDAKE